MGLQGGFDPHSKPRFTGTEAGAEKRLVGFYVGDDEADWLLDEASHASAPRALDILKRVAPRLGFLQAEHRWPGDIFERAVYQAGERNGLGIGPKRFDIWEEIEPLIDEARERRAAELAEPHQAEARRAVLAGRDRNAATPDSFDRDELKGEVEAAARVCASKTGLPLDAILDDLIARGGLTAEEIGPTLYSEAPWRAGVLKDMKRSRRIAEEARDFPEIEGWKAPRLLANPIGAAASPIAATAFRLGDATKLPPREWLYGTTLIRKFISVTVAPGGVGKSSLTIVEALAMVTGRPLLGVPLPAGPLRVWLWNGEDPLDELSRRFHAACIRHEVDEAAIGGRLFVNSGRDMGLVVMREVKKEVVAVEPVVEAVIVEIEAKKIDVLIVDPFVTTHEVSENDNTAMNRVAVLWGQIANRTGCAIMLVHHAKKVQGAEVNAEDARGASSLNSASRMTRTLNAMTKDEADRFGVNPDERLSHIRIGDDNGKANLTPRSGRNVWFRLASVALGNGRGDLDPGDEVGVVEAWAPPSVESRSALSREEVEAVRVEINRGEHRLDERADRWVGHAVGRALALDLDPSKPEDRKRVRAHVKAVIKRLIDERHLAVVERPDAARKLRDFVVIGPGSDE